MSNSENSFATKLNRLFEEKRKPDGTSYSKKEVVESSPLLSRIHLWRLQSGKVPRPSYEIVKALADFFGVHPDYFFEGNEVDETSIKSDQKEELQVLLRSFGLDQNERKAVILMVESLKKGKER